MGFNSAFKGLNMSVVLVTYTATHNSELCKECHSLPQHGTWLTTPWYSGSVTVTGKTIYLKTERGWRQAQKNYLHVLAQLSPWCIVYSLDWCHLTNAFRGARRQLKVCLRQIQTWSASDLCLQPRRIATYVTDFVLSITFWSVTMSVKLLYAIHILDLVNSRFCFAWRLNKMLFFSNVSSTVPFSCLHQTDR